MWVRQGMMCVGIALLFLACAQMEWMKEGATAEEARQAYGACQMLTVQPPPIPNRGITPQADTSSLEAERCMTRKGFTRVKKGEPPRSGEVLSTPSFPTQK